MMTSRHAPCVLLWLALLTSKSLAATDPQTLLNASERLLAPAASRQAFTLTMQGVFYAREQASRPEEPVAEVRDRQNVVLTRDGRYRLESDTVFPGAIRFHYLTLGSPTSWATVDVLRWRDGDEIDRTQAPNGAEEFSDLLLLAPGLLLTDARARAPQLQVDQSSGDLHVTFRDRAKRSVVIAIDPTTKRVKAATAGNTRYVYDDYRQQSDIWQPQRVDVFRGAQLRSRWHQVSMAATNLDARTFELPAGYVERTERAPLRATSLGQGAYRIDGSPSGYHTGFVVGSDAVAVFDSPIGLEEAQKVRAVIERTARGRRIAYVVASHTHGDHVGGLLAYHETGATVVAGKGGRIALRRQFPGLPERVIEEVSKPRTLDLGDVNVVLYPVASSHAAEMLVSYAPASRTVFQGDLFYMPEVGAVPATFEGGLELSRLIEAQRLDVIHIVGVHGRSGQLADLAEAVKLRRSRIGKRLDHLAPTYDRSEHLHPAEAFRALSAPDHLPPHAKRLK